MKKDDIARSVEATLQERGLFLVEITVSKDNEIEIVIEKDEGMVDWEDCAAVDKAVHGAFDQDVEDYALTVSSAGLDRPFKVLRQYLQAIGTQIDVKLKGGKRLKGELKAANEESIVLAYQALETVEGKKKKERVSHEDAIALSEINSVTPVVDFD